MATKYLLAYHGGGMPETQEQQAQVLAAWGEWFQHLGHALVDGGNPVGSARTIANGTVTDGGGVNPVSGYSIIEAATLEAAVEMAKGCPLLTSGGRIEVCETFNAM